MCMVDDEKFFQAKEPATSQMTALIARLTGVDVAKPRQPIPFNLWAKANRRVIDAEYDTKYRFNKPSKSDRLKLRAQITKELYAKLSDEEKQTWADAAKREHGEATEKWDNMLHGPPSKDPADRQR